MEGEAVFQKSQPRFPPPPPVTNRLLNNWGVYRVILSHPVVIDLHYFHHTQQPTLTVVPLELLFTATAGQHAE